MWKIMLLFLAGLHLIDCIVGYTMCEVDNYINKYLNKSYEQKIINHSRHTHQIREGR